MKKIYAILIILTLLLSMGFLNNAHAGGCNYSVTLINNTPKINSYNDSINLTVKVDQTIDTCSVTGFNFNLTGARVVNGKDSDVPGTLYDETRSSGNGLSASQTFTIQIPVSKVMQESLFAGTDGIRMYGKLMNFDDFGNKNEAISNPLCVPITSNLCSSGAPPADGKDIRLEVNNIAFKALGSTPIIFSITGMIPNSDATVELLSPSLNKSLSFKVHSDRNGFASTKDQPYTPKIEDIADDWVARVNVNKIPTGNEVDFKIGQSEKQTGNEPQPIQTQYTFEIQNPLGSYGSLEDLINGLVGWLVKIAIPIAVIMILYAGILFLTAGQYPQNYEKAKTTLFYVVIGLTIIFIGKGFISLIKSILQLSKGQ